MKRFKSTMFGVKEHEHGKYVYFGDYLSQNNELIRKDSEIKNYISIIEKLSSENEKANDTLNNVLREILFNLLTDPKEKDKLIRSVYDIGEDCEHAVIEIFKHSKTIIGMTKKTK